MWFYTNHWLQNIWCESDDNSWTELYLESSICNVLFYKSPIIEPFVEGMEVDEQNSV
jgi:hypothetical protein